MKQIFKMISAMMITTVMSLASSTSIIDSGIGNELDRINQALNNKKNELTMANRRIQAIAKDVSHSKQQIMRYNTLQKERENVEAACRNQRMAFKMENLWNEPMAKEKDRECFSELKEEIPIYKKLAQYAVSLLESIESLGKEAKILGINTPILEATIVKLKAHKILEENK